MLQEYSSGGDLRHGLIFMSAYMLVQQSATFWSKRLTLLTFSATLFGCILLAHLFDVRNFDGKLIGVVMGFSLICIAYALQQSRHLAIASFWYFLGAVLLMWSVFETAEHFTNTLGWPIALVMISVALIGLSSLAVKLNSKYIKTNS